MRTLMRSLGVLAGLFASAMLLAGPAGAQPASGGKPGGEAATSLRITGTVKDAKGAPVAGAKVWLAANPVVTAATGTDGAFALAAPHPTGLAHPPSIPATRPAEHTVAVSKDGFLNTYQAVPGPQAAGLSITLLDKLPADTAAAPAPELAMGLCLNDRQAVVTMTFDDNQPSQLTRAKPLFDAFGYRCTFYLITGRVGKGASPTWDQWKAADAEGYEIGNHTSGHWLKPGATPEEQAWNRKQVYDGFDDLTRNMGKPPLTFAFPGGGENATTQEIVRKSPHVDWRNYVHKVKGDRVYPEGDTLKPEDGIKNIDKCLAHTKAWNGAELSWFLFYMHDVTEPRAEVLKTMLQYIHDRDDQVWCTTYAAATLYEREREKSALKVESSGPKSVTFTLTNDLDPKIFNVPVTVVIKVPGGTPGARAVQAAAARDGKGGPVEVRVRDGRILVNVVPGPQPVRVNWE